MYFVNSNKQTEKLKKFYNVNSNKQTERLKKLYVVNAEQKLEKLWSSSYERFIYVNSKTTIYSDDGMSWNEPVGVSGDGYITSMAHGNDCVVVSFSRSSGGANKVAAYSKDGGETWTVLSFTPSKYASNGYDSSKVFFLNGKFRLFMRIYDYTYIDYYSSDDGVNWTFDGRHDPTVNARIVSEKTMIYYAKYNDEYRYIITNDSYVLYSTNLYDWTEIYCNTDYNSIGKSFVVDDEIYFLIHGRYDTYIHKLTTEGIDRYSSSIDNIRSEDTVDLYAYDEDIRTLVFTVEEGYYTTKLFTYNFDSKTSTLIRSSLGFDPTHNLICANGIWLAFNTPYQSGTTAYYSIDGGVNWTNVGCILDSASNYPEYNHICYTG